MAKQLKMKGFTSRYKSDFNAGVFEFERMDMLLREIDRLSVYTTNLNRDAILEYFALVKQFYMFLRPFVLFGFTETVRNQFDENCNNLWLETLDYKLELMQNSNTKYPLGLVKRIGDFYGELGLMKQLIGLGTPLTKEEKPATVIRRYLKASQSVKTDERFDKQIAVR